MPKINAKHPGVSLINEKAGGVFYATFRHPLRDNAKVRMSTETTDYGVAERIARELSGLIRNPETWRHVPDTSHPRTKVVWGEEKSRAAENLGEAIAALKALRPTELERLFDRENPSQPVPTTVEKILDEMKRAEGLNIKLREVTEQLKTVDAVIHERDALREENKNLKATLAKLQGHYGGKVRSVKADEAVELFFKEGGSRSTSANFRAHVDGWWNAFAKQVPAAKRDNSQNIAPDDLWQWVYSRFSTGEIGPSLARQQVDCIFAVLRHFNPTLSCDELKKQKRKHFVLGDKEWFWLEPAQSEALVAALREHLPDQYWADVATIQRGCGFRSEELPLIQSTNCYEANGKWQVRLAPICGKDGAPRRTLKTLRSAATVEVPTWAVPALKRRLAKKQFLLFPHNEESGIDVCAPRFHSGYTDFERQHELWPSASDESEFSSHYLDALRSCCVLACLENPKSPLANIEDPEQIVSRTFRATCGRELILNGLSETQVAAVLRDKPETVKRHYARLFAADVSTER